VPYTKGRASAISTQHKCEVPFPGAMPRPQYRTCEAPQEAHMVYKCELPFPGAMWY
jgi:hypothetical protein